MSWFGVWEGVTAMEQEEHIKYITLVGGQSTLQKKKIKHLYQMSCWGEGRVVAELYLDIRMYVQHQDFWTGCEGPCSGSRSRPTQPCRELALVLGRAISPGRILPFCSELLPDIEVNSCKASRYFYSALCCICRKKVDLSHLWEVFPFNRERNVAPIKE